MGVCETDELDRLSGVPILDVTELPPACPKCLEAMEEEDIESCSCHVCGFKLED